MIEEGMHTRSSAFLDQRFGGPSAKLGNGLSSVVGVCNYGTTSKRLQATQYLLKLP